MVIASSCSNLSAHRDGLDGILTEEELNSLEVPDAELEGVALKIESICLRLSMKFAQTRLPFVYY